MRFAYHHKIRRARSRMIEVNKEGDFYGSISFSQKGCFFYSASVPARVLYTARERGRSHYKCKTEMHPFLLKLIDG